MVSRVDIEVSALEVGAIGSETFHPPKCQLSDCPTEVFFQDPVQFLSHSCAKLLQIANVLVFCQFCLQSGEQKIATGGNVRGVGGGQAGRCLGRMQVLVLRCGGGIVMVDDEVPPR